MLRIDCDGVTKRFSRAAGPRLLRSYLLSFLRRSSIPESTSDFYALRNVSLQVSTGESVALVGRNGAGKSTLLSLITGLAAPEEGSLRVSGKIAALLELGSGFHGDLTGRENLMLNAALLGFSRRETLARLEEIVAFAEIGEFIDQPLRTYSSGMVLRLAFSIAVNLDPDILIIDEILAVGDQAFQEKCFRKVMEFRHAGKTILAVSHATSLLLQLCDRGLWLDHGQVVMDGQIQHVLQQYEQSIHSTAGVAVS